MRTIGACAIALILVITQSAIAEPMVGAGMNKCEDLNFVYAQPNSREVAAIMVQQWATGFFTAMNLLALSMKRGVRDIPTDLPTIEAKIRTFCDRNPNVSTTEAVIDTYGKLPPIR